MDFLYFLNYERAVLNCLPTTDVFSIPAIKVSQWSSYLPLSRLASCGKRQRKLAFLPPLCAQSN